MNQMKCSVSMTSLDSPQKSSRTTPEGQQKKPWPGGGRECCSLNAKKPRRTLDKKMWRRSWGSNNEDSGQEEFWRICQQSVQELVEANSDEQGLRHFLENYSNICEWLNSMQIERGRFADALRLSQLAEDMSGKQHWRVEVNETAKCLSQKYQNLKEEFQWRLKHLNSQWDALEKILSRQQNSTVEVDTVITPNNEGKDCDLDWVRDWLREKENELQPLDFRTEWTQELLEQEVVRYKTIQQEIEEKASAIHGVLRQQQQSRATLTEVGLHNGKENSKRSRLETRWLQLRLRVLEWVQHLSGVAERQKNLKKGRRSDNFYSASNWDSDGDNNEPLRKCPKFDDGEKESVQSKERIVPTQDFVCSEEDSSSLFSQELKQKSIDLVKTSSPSSQSQTPYKVEEKEEKQLPHQHDNTIISNQGQLVEQVVSTTPSASSSCSVPSQQPHQPHHQQVFLLNQQQLQKLLLRGIREEEIGSIVSVTLDEVDCDMGQSHDSEHVFSQTEPQFPNSVVEFTFDGSQCVGMKRKLSSTTGSPPLTPSSDQQVVPRNISIYYFKHSDTEPEPNHSQQPNANRGNRHHQSSASSSTRSPQQSRRALARGAHCEKSASECKLANCTCLCSGTSTGGVSGSRKGASRPHHVCQKSRLFLDFDQEFEDDITSLKSYDEISFGSFDLDLDEELEEGEVGDTQVTPSSSSSSAGGGGQPSNRHHPKLSVSGEAHFSMMDLEGNLCLSEETTEAQLDQSNNLNGNNNKGKSCTANNSNKPVVRLDEIEELVQKAELLVQQSTRSRGVECVDLPVQVGSSDDDEEENGDESMLMLAQKQSGDQHHHHAHHYYHHHHHHNHHHFQQQQIMMIAAEPLSPSPLSSGVRLCEEIGKQSISPNGSSSISNGHGSQELLHSPPQKFAGFHSSVRKCSVSSGVSSSSFTSTSVQQTHHQKVAKSGRNPASNNNILPSSLSSWSTAVMSGGGGSAGEGCGSVQQLNSRNSRDNKDTMSDLNNGSPKGMPIVGSNPTPPSTNVSCVGGGGESGSASASCGAPTPNNSGAATVNKTSKRNARIRNWIRSHNSEIVVNQKNTSSCDASAESASDSEYSTSSGSDHPVSSDDPTTTISISTFLHQTHAALVEANAKALSSCSSSNNISGSGTLLACSVGAAAASLSPGSVKSSSHHFRSPLASCSDVGNQTLTPSCSGTIPHGHSGTVPLRSKKRLSFGKQRPKSFTDTLDASSPNNSTLQGGPCVGSPGRASWLRASPSYFVSDSAINLLGNRSNNSCSEGSGSSSGGDCACGSPGNVDSPTHPKKKGTSRFKKRSQKGRRKTLQNEDTAVGDESKETRSSILRSSSFTESASGPITGEKRQTPQGADRSSTSTSSPKPNFLISGPISGHLPYNRVTSENGSSLNTEELNTNEQADWDSYQEKYLSEPYSEEPYDAEGTLKLLAFGEDYGQFLDHAESESSSMLSGFEPADSRKRRTLTLANRGEMADSDSDREELNYLLRQSSSQLRFIDVVFRGLLAKAESSGEAPTKYAEMEATCEENISSLKLILSNIEETENLPFEIDVKSIEGVLEKWHILGEKIRQAANIHHIKEEMGGLKMDFSNVHSLFCTCKQFDITDMDSLREKIRSIEDVLNELPTRKLQLQHLNDASLKTQVLLEDQDAVGIIKQQLNELYVLYEDNLQLGTFLLEKMRFLQDAWEQFEKEKQEFEKSVSVSNLRSKLRKEFSSSASTDSGHGTDFSHDSSISDSDMEFQERHKKLVALKERAKKVKAFLPPGSPVLEMLDQSVEEAEKGLTSLKSTSSPSSEMIDLKSLYPRKKPFAYSRRNSGQRSPKGKLLPPPTRKAGRKWTVVRRMVMFNVALVGIFLAAAYFLHPKCCEFTNTFCFSLVPHLTHESLPPI